MGLGSCPEIGLAEAAETALAGRRLAHSGVDPIADRKKGEAVPTLGELADEIASHLAEGFRHEKQPRYDYVRQGLRGATSFQSNSFRSRKKNRLPTLVGRVVNERAAALSERHCGRVIWKPRKAGLS